MSYASIINGRFKGTKLSFDPKAGKTTKQIVKKGLISSILSHFTDISQLSMLDAFAGHGAIGIEAISCGIGGCDFIEIEPKLCRSINNTLIKLNVLQEQRYTVQRADFWKVGLSKGYDIIFLDPPFFTTDYDKLIDFVMEGLKAQNKEAMIIVSSDRRTDIKGKHKKVRVYANTKITYLQTSESIGV